MKRGLVWTLCVVLAAATAGCGIRNNQVNAPASLHQYEPGFNLFSKEQDVELGKKAAQEIEKQVDVVSNRELNDYVRLIGKRLAAQQQADKYPYTFQVVNDPSINAFALPGGPTFVHTGLIAAADNESQIAGVLAHEITHVALRHGTNQVSKANLISCRP
jgi:predicted Zn-dependent protease